MFVSHMGSCSVYEKPALGMRFPLIAGQGIFFFSPLLTSLLSRCLCRTGLPSSCRSFQLTPALLSLKTAVRATHNLPAVRQEKKILEKGCCLIKCLPCSSLSVPSIWQNAMPQVRSLTCSSAPTLECSLCVTSCAEQPAYLK